MVLVVALIGGQLYLKSAAHAPSSTAATAQKQATTKNGVLYFGKASAKLTVVMYPGALVDPGAYSIWAAQVAKAGYRVAIVSFPDDLAVFKPNAASTVVKSGQAYVIGGSLPWWGDGQSLCRQAQTRLKRRFFLSELPRC
jgi:hypothetical protein